MFWWVQWPKKVGSCVVRADCFVWLRICNPKPRPLAAKSGRKQARRLNRHPMRILACRLPRRRQRSGTQFTGAFWPGRRADPCKGMEMPSNMPYIEYAMAYCINIAYIRLIMPWHIAYAIHGILKANAVAMHEYAMAY